MANEREQPPREVLFAHSARSKVPPARDRQLGTAVPCNHRRAPPPRGVTMRIDRLRYMLPLRVRALLRAEQVARRQQLLSISGGLTDQLSRMPLAYPTYRALATRARTFSGIAAFATLEAVVATTGEPQQIQTAAVSGNYFSVLGLRPQLGRLISPADDDVPGAHFVAVLSDALWAHAYGRNPAIIGSTIKIGNN